MKSAWEMRSLNLNIKYLYIEYEINLFDHWWYITLPRKKSQYIKHTKLLLYFVIGECVLIRIKNQYTVYCQMYASNIAPFISSAGMKLWSTGKSEIHKTEVVGHYM